MGEKDMYLNKYNKTKKAYYLSLSWEITFNISILQNKQNTSSYITASVPPFHLTPKDLILIFMKLFSPNRGSIIFF